MTVFRKENSQLEADGPLIEVTFGFTDAAIAAANTAGDPIPPLVTATAIIDTGAGGTAVQVGLLDSLGLNPVGTSLATTPTTVNHPCSQYAVRLGLPQGYLEITVVELPLQGQNIQVLLGRDVLKFGLLIYDGMGQRFSLAF